MAVHGEEVCETLSELGVGRAVGVEVCYDQLLEEVGVCDELR